MEARILTAEEIATLNRDGANLKSGNFYLTAFLINSQPNDAGDPRPFQILPEALDKFSKSAIGRPFVLGANGKKHVRPPSSFHTAQDIINYQKQYAAGEIVHEYINPETGNANVIVQVFPEYVEDFKAGRIPPYVSPLIENSSVDLLERNGRLLIQDGRILHLQAVDKPGYGEVATIHGTCEGMLGECMNELRLLGASGALRQFQDNYISSQFSSTNLHSKGIMSDSVSTTLTAEQITKIIDEKFAALQTLGASGAAAAQEQETVKSLPPANEGEPAAQIAIDPKIVELQSQVDKLQAANEEAAGKLAKKERADQAREIVEVELLSKSIPLTKKADRLKQLVDSKDDLTSIVKYMRENRGKILGASRGDVAQFHASEEESPVDHFAYFESLGRKN